MVMVSIGRPARGLIELQLKLECIAWTAQDTLKRIEGPDPDAMGLVYVFLPRDDPKPLILINESVDEATQNKIRQLDPHALFKDPSSAEKLLSPLVKSKRFFGGYFKPGFQSTESETIHHSDAGKTRVEITLDDKVVCTCESSRENTAAAEAWVWTEQEYKRKGLAFLAVRNWAAAVQAKNKVAFYSYEEGNTASNSLAEKVGVHIFVEAVIIGEETK
jgi:hypothetical protein